MKRLAVFILFSYLGFCSLASGQTEIITTIAGGGTSSLANGGPATSASLSQPGGIAVDASGDLFIADTTNNRILEVSSGNITTVVGNGGLAASPLLYQPGGVFVDASGNLFIADTGNNMIRKVAAGNARVTTIAGGGSEGFYGDGGPATSAALWTPGGVTVDASGNVFIADTVNNRIREVSATTGIITTVAGTIQGFSGDGGPATSAQLNNPTGVFVDASGNIFIADKLNNRIRKVSAGTITTVAGNGIEGFSGDNGPATSAALYSPSGVFVDASGNIFIAVAFSNRIREVSGGIITTVAGNGAQVFAGDGGLATSASLSRPSGVAVDASGDVFIADTNNNRIREVSASTVPAPSITSGGIVPVDSTVTTIQSGEWVSIYGTNLAGSTATWTGNFPILLGGTRVTIDGNAAFLWFVSPGQINLQVPDDTFTGPVSVVVNTASGSSTSTVTLAQFAPSFLLLDSKHVTGIIPRSNGSGAYDGGAYDIIGPTGSSLGYPTVAAKAGDGVELYAVGFGPTSPTVHAGQAFSGQAPTTSQVNLLINGTSVTPSLSFAGLSSAGLYQINLTIPAGLGTGDVSLAATVGGAQTQAGVVISLQ
jgi:trimeric autotransporter adhesin